MEQDEQTCKKAMTTIVKAVEKQKKVIAKIKVLQGDIAKFQESVNIMGASVTEEENAEMQRKSIEYLREVGKAEYLNECINICASAIGVNYRWN